MVLPAQIRKQTEAVQELYKQLNSEDQGEQDPKPNAEDAGDPAQQQSATDLPEARSGEQPQPVTKNEDPFEHKYRTLQGMYNADTTRFRQVIQEQGEKIQQMEQLLSSLAKQKQAPQPEPVVTDKDLEEYGESIDVMRRVSRGELNPLQAKIEQLEGIIRQMQSSVVPQVKAVVQKQQMSAEQQFWNDLTTLLPDWRAVNDNQRFQDWLLEADPMTGLTRQTYLEDAQGNLDARRVASIFSSWKGLTGQNTPVQENRSKSELEKQVAPGKGRSGPAPVEPNQGKVYAPEDIAAFYADVRQGKYKGRDEERAKIERDIFAAQRENRIKA